MKIKSLFAVVALASFVVAGYSIALDAPKVSPVADYSTSSTSFACGNIMQEWELTVDETLPQEAIDAMIDGACEALEGNYQEQPELYTSVMTCFDDDGMVTTGDNWRECFPMNIQAYAAP